MAVQITVLPIVVIITVVHNGMRTVSKSAIKHVRLTVQVLVVVKPVQMDVIIHVMDAIIIVQLIVIMDVVLIVQLGVKEVVMAVVIQGVKEVVVKVDVANRVEIVLVIVE